MDRNWILNRKIFLLSLATVSFGSWLFWTKAPSFDETKDQRAINQESPPKPEESPIQPGIKILEQVRAIQDQQKLSREILMEPQPATSQPSSTYHQWEASRAKLQDSIARLDVIKAQLNELMLSHASKESIQETESKYFRELSIAQDNQDQVLKYYKIYQLELEKLATTYLEKGI